MVKYNYYDTLESLAEDMHHAIRLATTPLETPPQKTLSALRGECDKKLYSLENMLFCDFLPPLDRDNIAAFAHCLVHVTENAFEHAICFGSSRTKTEEESICLRLAEEILKSTMLLRKLRSSSALPDIRTFRELLRRGREAHGSDLSRCAVSTSKQSAGRILSAGRLRMELSRCFDELIEVMLNNI